MSMSQVLYVDLPKFFHLLFALILLGVSLLAFVSVVRRQSPAQRLQALSFSLFLDWILWVALAITFVTGTVLVVTRHVGFHTHWIQAAYLFLGLAAGLVAAMHRWKLKTVRALISGGRAKAVFHLYCLQSVFFLILIFIVHDAVTKTTFF